MKRSSSGRVSLRVLLAITGVFLLPLWLTANPPSWWQTRQVVQTSTQPDHFAAANLGQLKNFVAGALAELTDKLPANYRASSTEFQTLVEFVAAFETTTPANHNAINSGQLKNAAAKVYDVLIDVQYRDASGNLVGYPWSSTPSDDDNKALANQGMLKNVFKFDVGKSADGDTIPDWYETAHGLDPLANNSTTDLDQDGFSDAAEFAAWTDPQSYYSQPGNLAELQFVKISGDQQQSQAGSYLAAPLIVELRNGSTPLQNAPVTFTVNSGDGGVSLTSGNTNPSPSVNTQTDTTGRISLYYRQGATVTTDIQIQATAGPATPLQFTILAPGIQIQHTVEILAGDKQGVLANSSSYRPIKVVVKDPSGQPMPSTPIEAILEETTLGGLSITQGASPQTTLPLTTDTNGQAEFWFKANALPAAPARIFIQPPGHPENRVTAQLAIRSASEFPSVTDGLIAWYKGEQNDDDSWGLHHATNSGATYAPGLRSQAFDFNGTTAFVQTPIANGAERTLVAWFQARNSGDVPHIASLFDSEISGAFGTGLGMDNGQLKVLLNNLFWEPSAPIDLDQWYQAALVIQPTEARLYLNGQLLATHTYTQGPITAANYKIGQSNAHPDQAFDGMIDEIGIYDRALSSSEITSLHTQNADTDGDGMPDAWEIANGLDPFDGTGDDGPYGDKDNDGITNLQEYLDGTNPNNVPPNPADSDGDGMVDNTEPSRGRVVGPKDHPAPKLKFWVAY